MTLSGGSMPSEVFRISDEYLSVVVLPAHGFTVLSLTDVSTGADALWEREPFTAATPSRSLGSGGSASEVTFLDRFIGGWFEMFPVVGFPDGSDPVQLLHGEVMRLPWSVVSASATSIAAEVSCLRSPFYLIRLLELDDGELVMRESIKNIGRTKASYSWGHHPCFSRNTFAGGRMELNILRAEVPAPHYDSRRAILAAGEEFRWPNAPNRDGGTVDISAIPERPDYRHDHVCIRAAEGVLRLTAPKYRRVLTVAWDLMTFPFVLVWQDFQGQDGYPMFGCSDTFAIEFSDNPGRTMEEARREGPLRTLLPGAATETTIRVSWHDLTSR
jgi:galactose mutarotase-like enzyme